MKALEGTAASTHIQFGLLTMYETFYHLQGQAFHLNPDPRFLFTSSRHSRTLDYLRYGLYKGEGLIVVTGDVGAGKTTLVYKLLEELAEQKDIIAAHLVATQRKAEYLLPMITTAFGLVHEKLSNVILFQQLEKFLIDQAQQGKRVLLVVDEAQNLSAQALEVLRLLTNYQINYKAPLQVFLVGQAEFRNMLFSKQLEQLRQRVIASCHLGPMELDEIRPYIEHRLSVVGWNGDPNFTPEAYVAIHTYTGGVPRRINMLCNRVLVLGCLKETHEITEQLVNTIIQELDEESLGTDSDQTQSASVQPDMPSQTLVKQRMSQADNHRQKPAFFKRQKSLIGSLLFILTGVGAYYLLNYYDDAWSVQRMLAVDTGSAPPEPVVTAIQTGKMPVAVNASEGASISAVQIMPVKPKESELQLEPVEANSKAALNKPPAQPIPVSSESNPAPVEAESSSVESVVNGMAASSSPAAAVNLAPSNSASSTTQKPSTQTSQSAVAIPITDYMRKGDRLLELGDIASARLFYEAAARAGYAPALTAVGKTYDPQVLNHRGLRGIYTDPVKAAQWYRQAVQAGDPEAADYLRSVVPLAEGRSDQN